jgi:hypothetical protein
MNKRYILTTALVCLHNGLMATAGGGRYYSRTIEELRAYAEMIARNPDVWDSGNIRMTYSDPMEFADTLDKLNNLIGLETDLVLKQAFVTLREVITYTPGNSISMADIQELERRYGKAAPIKLLAVPRIEMPVDYSGIENRERRFQKEQNKYRQQHHAKKFRKK